MNGRPVSSEEAAEIARLAREGLTYRQISDHIGRPQGTIAAVARREGVARKKRLSPEERSEIARRYANGERSSVLSREFGCSYKSIQRAAHDYGYEVRRGRHSTRLDSDEANRALAMSRSGVPIAEIAEALHKTSLAVERALIGLDPNWTGDPFTGSGGYLYRSLSPLHPLAPVGVSKGENRSVRIPEHRYMMSRHLGRALLPTETVHHINGVRDDNRIENLQLRIGAHGQGAAFQCQACGSHDVVAVPLG